MARRGKEDRLLCQRPQAQAARGDDRMSDLSDDLLLLILGRLDTRTALGTGLLSRRWACLPRELPALDFRVGDVLPPRYHRLVLLHRDIYEKGIFFIYKRHVMKTEVMPNIRRYECRAMRALPSSVEGILDADDDGGNARRSLSRLRLEFFTTHNTGCINRLIAKSMDAWGVHDLEAVAKPLYRERDAHSFPSHGLCHEPRASRLRSLKLGGCVLPPLHEYGTLTRLVLESIPKSTPRAADEGVFTLCPQLQVLHLISCSCGEDMVMAVDAPS